MVLPPRVAPIQVIIIPIVFKDSDRDSVMGYVKEVKSKLTGSRVEVDVGDERPGAKYFKWEQRGVPVRIEVGPKEVKDRTVVVVRRDTGGKMTVLLGKLKISELLKEIEDSMRGKARERFDSRQYTADTLVDFRDKAGKGIVTVGWCGNNKCAKPIDETGTILTLLNEEADCIVCGKKGRKIRVAKTY
jgi:prolyl-tRNA synthetase